MQKLLKSIRGFKGRVEFVSEKLGLFSKHIESKPMTKEEKYSLIEPYIELLILSTSTGDEEQNSIKPEFKRIVNRLEAGHTAWAIKRFREYFSIGLKESTNEVERVYDLSSECWLVDKWEYDGELIWKKNRRKAMV